MLHIMDVLGKTFFKVLFTNMALHNNFDRKFKLFIETGFQIITPCLHLCVARFNNEESSTFDFDTVKYSGLFMLGPDHVPTDVHATNSRVLSIHSVSIGCW